MYRPTDERYATLEDEWAAATGGQTWTSVDHRFRRVSSELVPIGWLAKTEGWLATGIGNWSLREYPDPEYWRAEVARRYSAYLKDRELFDLVETQLLAVPSGYWVRASDLAENTGLTAERVIHYLVGNRPEGWFRVLDTGGRLPADAHLTDLERFAWLGLLEADGIEVETRRADRLRQLAAADLRGDRAGGAPGQAPRAAG
jgi:5-methylcytosine-specific restriction protein B